ncbi:MAG: flavodoxin family protein [Clostridiaceae bacterium]
MKKLVVYYSFEGNTKYIAESIAEAVGADILQLKPVSDIKNTKFTKYLWGGKQVVTGKMPELKEITVDFEEYDFIFIGTPVWAFSFAPAINTFLSKYSIKDKKIGLFCCDGGTKGKTFENMRERLKENDIIGEIEFAEPVKNIKAKAETAKEWARAIIQK